MAKHKRKQSRKRPGPPDRNIKPTDARLAHNDAESAGPAVRMKPTIDTLYRAGKLSVAQLEALRRYADTASDRSEVKSNMDFSVSGNGEGLPHFGVRMNRELDRMNAALGGTRWTAYAICVRGLSLSAWAMERCGSVARQRLTDGGKIVRWFEPRKSVWDAALLELQAAGDRLDRANGG
tara:strand:+ start:1300 stop:1836 length:537 start_codon:yes stop_codon:yes gene_type:complete